MERAAHVAENATFTFALEKDAQSSSNDDRVIREEPRSIPKYMFHLLRCPASDNCLVSVREPFTIFLVSGTLPPMCSYRMPVH